jgi:hypothetical protein
LATQLDQTQPSSDFWLCVASRSGLKRAYVFQGHLGEIILFTLDGRVYRASSTAEATNFDESLLDSLLSPAAQQIKLKQLMFKNSN